MMEEVLVEIRGNIYIVTLNRPEYMNAINMPTLLKLRRIVNDLRFNSDVRTRMKTGL